MFMRNFIIAFICISFIFAPNYLGATDIDANKQAQVIKELEKEVSSLREKINKALDEDNGYIKTYVIIPVLTAISIACAFGIWVVWQKTEIQRRELVDNPLRDASGRLDSIEDNTREDRREFAIYKKIIVKNRELIDSIGDNQTKIKDNQRIILRVDFNVDINKKRIGLLEKEVHKKNIFIEEVKKVVGELMEKDKKLTQQILENQKMIETKVTKKEHKPSLFANRSLNYDPE